MRLQRFLMIGGPFDGQWKDAPVGYGGYPRERVIPVLDGRAIYRPWRVQFPGWTVATWVYVIDSDTPVRLTDPGRVLPGSVVGVPGQRRPVEDSVGVLV